MIIDTSPTSGRSTRSLGSRRSSRKKVDMSSRDLEDLDRTVASLFLNSGASSPITPIPKLDTKQHTLQTSIPFDRSGCETDGFSTGHGGTPDFCENFFDDSKVENWALNDKNHNIPSSFPKQPLTSDRLPQNLQHDTNTSSLSHIPNYNVEFIFNSDDDDDDTARKSPTNDPSVATSVSSNHSYSRRSKNNEPTKKKKKKKRKKGDRKKKSKHINLEQAVERHVLSTQRELCVDYFSDRDEFSVVSNMTSDDILYDLSDVEDDIASQCSASRTSTTGSMKGRHRKHGINRKLDIPRSGNNLMIPPMPIVESPARDVDDMKHDTVQKESDNNSDGHLEDLLQVLAGGAIDRMPSIKRNNVDLFAQLEKNDEKVKDPFATKSISSQKGNTNSTEPKKEEIKDNDDDFDPFGFSNEHPWNAGQVLDVSFDDPFNIDPTSSVSLTSSCEASSQGFWGDEHFKESSNPPISSSKPVDFFLENDKIDKHKINKKLHFSPINVNNKRDDDNEVKRDTNRKEIENEKSSLPHVDTVSQRNITRQSLNKEVKDFKSDNDDYTDFDPFLDSDLKLGSNRKLGSSIKALMRRSSPVPGSEGMKKFSSAKNALKRQTSHKKNVSEPLLATPFSPERGWETFINDGNSAWTNDNLPKETSTSSIGTSSEKDKNVEVNSKESVSKYSSETIRVRTVKLSSGRESSTSTNSKEVDSNRTPRHSNLETRDDLKPMTDNSSVNLSSKSEDGGSDIEPRVLFGDTSSSNSSGSSSFFSSSKDTSDGSNNSASTASFQNANENEAPWFHQESLSLPSPQRNSVLSGNGRKGSAVVGRRMKERLNENFPFGNFRITKGNISEREKMLGGHDYRQNISPNSVI